MSFLLIAAQDWCPWCGDHMTGGGWGMMFGWTILLIVILLLIWAVFMGPLRRDRAARGRSREGAEEVLRERFARGEIDEESYRRQLDELRRTS